MRNQIHFFRTWVFKAVVVLMVIALPAGNAGLLAQPDLGKSVKVLQKSGLISKDVASGLRSDVSSGQVSDALELSQRMLDRESRLLMGKNYSPELSSEIASFSATLKGQVEPSTGEKLMAWTKSCTDSGLLNKEGAEFMKKSITGGTVWHRLLLLAALRNELHYQDAISPLKLQGLAQQLRANGLLAHPEDGKLIRLIDEQLLRDPIEMLDHCQNARRFDAKNYSLDPAVSLERIYEETALLLPDLKFTDFAWELVEEPQEGIGLGKTLLVSLKIGDFSYWQADPLGAVDPGPESFTGRLDPTRFYKIFNLALAEQGSLYRIHHVTCGLDEDRGMDPNRRFGLIALRESQPEAFRYLGSYYRFSKEDFRNALSRELVSGVIERYFSFGMFSRMTLPEYRKSREYALSNPRMSYEEVLDCFPGVFLDLDKAPLHSYAELLEEMAAISRGAFSPQAVENKERFSFEFGGDTWSAALRAFDSGPDPAFFALVDQAVATLPEGRFYLAADGRKLIFLNTEQWDLLYRQKVVGRQK